MSLIRLIVIALIIYLILRMLKRWSKNKNVAPSKQENKLHKMVRCGVCQLHIPEDEALLKNGDFFCSQAHLDDHQA